MNKETRRVFMMEEESATRMNGVCTGH
jgi:hypothetical protein